MHHQAFRTLPSTCLLALTLTAGFLFSQPASAVHCVWSPVWVGAHNSGAFKIRVADDQGAEKILRLCSLDPEAPGINGPATCSTYYATALAALAIGAELRIVLQDSELDVLGWDGSTCQSIAGNSNVDSALVEFAILAPS